MRNELIVLSMESHAESEFNDCGWVQVSHDNHEVTTIMR